MASVGPSSPKKLPPYPCWNTSTVTPKAAPTDTQFSTTALSGTSTERNAMNSMMAVTPRIIATMPGKRPSRFSWRSRLHAAEPRAPRDRAAHVAGQIHHPGQRHGVHGDHVHERRAPVGAQIRVEEL